MLLSAILSERNVLIETVGISQGKHTLHLHLFFSLKVDNLCERVEGISDKDIRT